MNTKPACRYLVRGYLTKEGGQSEPQVFKSLGGITYDPWNASKYLKESNAVALRDYLTTTSEYEDVVGWHVVAVWITTVSPGVVPMPQMIPTKRALRGKIS